MKGHQNGNVESNVSLTGKERKKKRGLLPLLLLAGVFWMAGACYAAENWIYLEEIYFNYDPGSSLSDALNIRKNWVEEVHVPEWKKDEEFYPAAFIKNRVITVKAVFSAAPGVKNANIGADQIRGRLGKIIGKNVSFKNGTSGPVFFKVSHGTPNQVTKFFQEWEWFCRDVNGNDSQKIHIGDSRNKIFIVLDEPQSPWKTTGQSEPWTDLLEYSCRWAAGRANREYAASIIARHIYTCIGGSYDNGSQYSADSCHGSFYLSKFLNKIKLKQHIGTVNCVDMAKSLVTFSNAVGCRLEYLKSEPFGTDLHCIKPIGGAWSCGSRFVFHAFGGTNGKEIIFDACFKADTSKYPDCSPHLERWLTNLHWAQYKAMLVKEGEAKLYSYDFSINGDTVNQAAPSLRRMIKLVKKKYRYKQWCRETGKVIPGVAISSETLPLLLTMNRIWKKSMYRFEKIEKDKYTVIRNRWKSKSDLLDITMVVGHTLTAVKEYLVYSYANTSGHLPNLIKKDIGNMCFVTPTAGKDYSQGLDFIRHNVLIIMRSKGRTGQKLEKIARQLDGLLLLEKPVNHYRQLKDIPRIIDFSCPKQARLGESVPLKLVISNPAKNKPRYLWRMSGGGIEEERGGGLIYYAGYEGRQRIRLTVINTVGLYDSRSLKIDVRGIK